MKYLVTIFCLLISLSINAQCKYDQDEVDDFEGFHRIKTNQKALLYKLAAEELYVSLVNNGDSYFIDIEAATLGSSLISEGAEAVFKLTDDSILRFVAVDTYISSIVASKARINARYKITEDDLNKLLIQPVAKVRLNFSDGYFDFDIKNKSRQKYIIELSQCLLAAADKYRKK